jgi:hypothetical protein
MVPVTAFFAGLLALVFLALTVYVIVRRYHMKLSLGDGGDQDMVRRIRAHANFAEYVPLALILMALNELNGATQGYLALMGVTLTFGRMSHFYSLTMHEAKPQGRIIFRQIGMGCTLTVIGVMALSAIF